MNREGRRAHAKAMKAIGRELTRAEKPDAYHLGFMDGGNAMVKACYAAFCGAMHKQGYSNDTIFQVIADVDRQVYLCAGNEELIQDIFDQTGLLIDFSEVLPDDRIQKKEETA